MKNVGVDGNARVPMRQLTDTELDQVGGGFLPLALGMIAGTVAQVANAHANGTSLWTAAFVGAASGLLTGGGGAMLGISKVAGITLTGAGMALATASGYSGWGGGGSGGYRPHARSDTLNH